MHWILGTIIVLLIVALLLVLGRDVRVGRHEQSVSHGFGRMIVGLSMISVGIVAALMDWSEAAFAIPAVGLVFVAVGAGRHRGSSS